MSLSSDEDEAVKDVAGLCLPAFLLPVLLIAAQVLTLSHGVGRRGTFLGEWEEDVQIYSASSLEPRGRALSCTTCSAELGHTCSWASSRLRQKQEQLLAAVFLGGQFLFLFLEYFIFILILK